MRKLMILSLVAMALGCRSGGVRENVQWSFVEDQDRKTTEELNRESEKIHERAIREATEDELEDASTDPAVLKDN